MRLEQVIFKHVVNRAVLQLYHSAATGPGNIEVSASRPRAAYECQHLNMSGQEVRDWTD